MGKLTNGGGSLSRGRALCAALGGGCGATAPAGFAVGAQAASATAKNTLPVRQRDSLDREACAELG